MKHFWRLLFGIALLGLAGGHPALAQQVKLRDGTLLPEKPFFVVTYIEIAPSEVQKAEGGVTCCSVLLRVVQPGFQQ